jgi:hypothetical protein
VDPFDTRFDGDGPAQAALAALREALQMRHHGSVESLLFYGSCLRSGDLTDGLVDLYVIVRDYRAAHRSLLAACANRLLAPNVYYLQVQAGSQTIRCKYAVFSAATLARGVSTRWFEPYLWGRLCQHVAIAWSADEPAHARASAALRQATITFLERALPALAPEGSLQQLWERGLALSYATELRAERAGRAGEIAAHGAPHAATATRAVAGNLRWPLVLHEDRYRASIPAAARRRARLAWALRRVEGKLLSVLRLQKALFTFEGGLDYIAWKLERHSGRVVAIPERVRRWPLLFVWGFMLKLRREGFFR